MRATPHLRLPSPSSSSSLSAFSLPLSPFFFFGKNGSPLLSLSSTMAKTPHKGNGHSSKAAKKASPAQGHAPQAPRPLPTTAAIVAVAADAPPKATKKKKEAALQRALAAAMGKGEATEGSSSTAPAAAPSEPSAPSEPDVYGKGSPADRLQFGYSPAVAEEAVAFHSRITAESWLRERRRSGRIAFVKHEKLPRMNLEPIHSVLKLKNHWSKVSQFQSSLHDDRVTAQDADHLLDMLAAKQRVDAS